jgi:hypothetical protein
MVRNRTVVSTRPLRSQGLNGGKRRSLITQELPDLTYTTTARSAPRLPFLRNQIAALAVLPIYPDECWAYQEVRAP